MFPIMTGWPLSRSEIQQILIAGVIGIVLSLLGFNPLFIPQRFGENLTFRRLLMSVPGFLLGVIIGVLLVRAKNFQKRVIFLTLSMLVVGILGTSMTVWLLADADYLYRTEIAMSAVSSLQFVLIVSFVLKTTLNQKAAIALSSLSLFFIAFVPFAVLSLFFSSSSMKSAYLGGISVMLGIGIPAGGLSILEYETRSILMISGIYGLLITGFGFMSLPNLSFFIEGKLLIVRWLSSLFVFALFIGLSLGSTYIARYYLTKKESIH